MAEYAEPRYDPPDTVAGRLQRGRGDGARQAVRQDAGAAVMACIGTDYRWDWQVDARPDYLARLVRDLGLPIAPIVKQLWESPDPNDWRDTANLFRLALRVLETMALVDDRARSEVTRYLWNGEYWIDVLESLSCTWPQEQWRALYPVAQARLSASDVEELHLYSDPWRTWLDEHADFAGRCEPRRSEREQRRESGVRKTSAKQLFEVIADPGSGRGIRSSALFALTRSGRVPVEILDLAGSMPFEHGPDADVLLTPGYARAVAKLGAAANGHARGWVAERTPGLEWLGYRTLARFGERCDLPVLARGVEELASGGGWCGYDTLFEGMVRLGIADDRDSAVARRAVERLRWLWESTPHSHERAAYLRCLLAVDAAGDAVVEGLWDCEEEVRRIAVGDAPPTAAVRQRLASMRADPLEDEEVRAAVAARPR